MRWEIIRNGQPVGVSFDTPEEAWEYVEQGNLPDGDFWLREEITE